MRKLTFVLSLLLLASLAWGQNLNLYKEVVKELSSEKYYGRGVTNQGDKKAADYISSWFDKYGLEKFNEDYFQRFNISVNTFPGSMYLSTDGNELRPGIDFVALEYSRGISGDFSLIYIDEKEMSLSKLLDTVSVEVMQQSFFVVDYYYFISHKTKMERIYESDIQGIIFRMESPIRWYIPRSYFVSHKTEIWVDKSIFSAEANSISVDIQNKFVRNYPTQNVIGYIEGSKEPDSLFVFTAHYDHLGMHGEKVFYPGANDNASGVAMLIMMAEYYSKPANTPDYSIVFMAFGAEETGLLGSKYYVENPLAPLENIKYLINMDMIADNAENLYFEINKPGNRGFEILKEINKSKNLFDSFDIADLRAMSDHYFFAISDVPTAFIALHGDAFKTLHTLNDVYENIYFDNILDIFKLLKNFTVAYR